MQLVAEPLSTPAGNLVCSVPYNDEARLMRERLQ